MFAFLDGASGYYEVEQRPAAFAVSLNVYQDFDDIDDGKEEVSIPIVPSDGGYDMHDMFLNLLDQMKNGDEWQLF